MFPVQEKAYCRRIFCKERGGAALYALVLIPFMVSLTVLAVDLSGWQTLRQETQAAADRLALDALLQLPDVQAATALVQSEAAQSEQGFQITTLITDSHKVTVGLKAQFDAVFDLFMEPIAGPQVFQVYNESTAQVVPTDYVLVIADGHTLRPVLIPGGAEPSYETPWGDPAEWPESGYFDCTLEPHILTPPEVWSWWQHWNESDFRRWATQSCFNPVLTELKRSAIAIVDSLSVQSTNRLGLVFTPGDRGGLGYAFARHVRGELTTGSGAQYFFGMIGGFIEQQAGGAESHWLNYAETESFLGDEACALFAQPLWDSTYPIPTLAASYGFPHQSTGCQNLVNLSPCGAPHFPYGRLSECYLDETLQVREAIYYHAAKHPLGAFSATPDVIAAAQQALVELVDVPTQEVLDGEAALRGNLGYSQLRKIIVLTDSLDGVAAGAGSPIATDPRFTQLVLDLATTRTQLIVGVIFHENLDAIEQVALAASVQSLNDAGSQLSDSSLIRVVVAQSPIELRQKATPLLIQLGREVALRK